jgi:uncharacterized membrane protein
MRNTADRIRHALSFEVLALLIVTPLASWIFGFAMLDIGVLAVAASTLATLWNYVYNLIFDRAMLRLLGRVQKTLRDRVVHAVLFELGLLIVLIPIIAWYLNIGLWQAFVMDASFSLFYLVYAFAFNWAYDAIFPIPPLTKKA